MKSKTVNHCTDCNEKATVTLNDVPYCTNCGIKNQQEDIDEDAITYGDLDENTKHFIYREL